MKEIRRPTTIEEVGTMMHLAEFFLVQARDLLINIELAPEAATPSPIYERVGEAAKNADAALKALQGET